MIRAAGFCTSCNLCMDLAGKPAKSIHNVIVEFLELELSVFVECFSPLKVILSVFGFHCVILSWSSLYNLYFKKLYVCMHV